MAGCSSHDPRIPSEDCRRRYSHERHRSRCRHQLSGVSRNAAGESIALLGYGGNNSGKVVSVQPVAPVPRYAEHHICPFQD